MILSYLFSLEFTIRKCLLTENSENYNNKDLLRHIRTALSFPGLTLNLFGLKVTQNHYLNAVLKKRKGFCYVNLMFPSIKNRLNSSLKTSFPVLLSRKKSYNGCCCIIDSKTFKRAKAKSMVWWSIACLYKVAK